MKKSSCLLVICVCVLCSCTNHIKRYLTVNKTITLDYDFNGAGTLQNTATLLPADIFELFITKTQSNIEKIDITGLSLSGEIDSQANTATQASISAQVISNGNAELLNTTKLVKVSNTELNTDVANAGIKYLTINNALGSINPTGLAIIKSFMSNSLNRMVTITPLQVRTNCVLLPNQRLVGKVYINIDASVTYFTCEKTIEIFSADLKCE